MKCKQPRATRARGVSRARGSVVVEFAIVLPLLLLILFGIIEYGWVFMIRQTVQNSAREGCRVAVLQSSTDEDIEARIAQVMQGAGLSSYSVQVTHADQTSSCEEVVTVSIPYDDVSLVGGFLGVQTETLAGSCTMRKEGCVSVGGG